MTDRKEGEMGTSLAARWLGLCFHCRVIPHATWCSQKNKEREREMEEKRRREGGGDWPREEIRLQIDFG